MQIHVGTVSRMRKSKLLSFAGIGSATGKSRTFRSNRPIYYYYCTQPSGEHTMINFWQCYGDVEVAEVTVPTACQLELVLPGFGGMAEERPLFRFQQVLTEASKCNNTLRWLH
jgi:hypothetical protein